MRHGVPEIKMKDDTIQNVKQEVNELCRVAGVLRFIMVNLVLVSCWHQLFAGLLEMFNSFSS